MFVMEPFVEVPFSDTSVDNAQKNAVQSGSDLTKGVYTNSNSPVRVFGDSILASQWNPFTSHGNLPSSVNQPVDHTSVQSSAAAAAAAVVSSES